MKSQGETYQPVLVVRCCWNQWLPSQLLSGQVSSRSFEMRKTTTKKRKLSRTLVNVALLPGDQHGRRGTDIKLGEGVRELGGSSWGQNVESRRIDKSASWTSEMSRGIQVNLNLLVSWRQNWCAVSGSESGSKQCLIMPLCWVKKNRSSVQTVHPSGRGYKTGLKETTTILVNKSFNTMTWCGTTGKLSTLNAMMSSQLTVTWRLEIKAKDQTDHQNDGWRSHTQARKNVSIFELLQIQFGSEDDFESDIEDGKFHKEVIDYLYARAEESMPARSEIAWRRVCARIPKKSWSFVVDSKGQSHWSEDRRCINWSSRWNAVDRGYGQNNPVVEYQSESLMLTIWSDRLNLMWLVSWWKPKLRTRTSTYGTQYSTTATATCSATTRYSSRYWLVTSETQTLMPCGSGKKFKTVTDEILRAPLK